MLRRMPWYGSVQCTRKSEMVHMVVGVGGVVGGRSVVDKLLGYSTG